MSEAENLVFLEKHGGSSITGLMISQLDRTVNPSSVF